MAMTNETRRSLLSISTGLALCAVVAWQQSMIADFSPSSGKTARGFIGEYLEMAYDQGRGEDAIKTYFAEDAIDHAPDAIERKNGEPIRHEIHQIAADGMTAVVYHRVEAARGAPAMEVVDIYKADRFSRIQERWRIAQPVKDAAPAEAAAEAPVAAPAK